MKHPANFNQTLDKPFLHEGNSSLFNESPSPLQRRDNYKSAKVG
jgi:hypothetical protein